MNEWGSFAEACAIATLRFSYPQPADLINDGIKNGKIRTRGSRLADSAGKLDDIPVLNPGQNYPGMIDDKGRLLKTIEEPKVNLHDVQNWLQQLKGDSVSEAATVKENVEVIKDAPIAPVTTYDTGDPGRRSSRHLYEAELKRRIGLGEEETSVERNAVALKNWLADTHSNAAQPAVRTVVNRIRPVLRNNKALPK